MSYKKRYIAGFAKCSTKDIPKLLTFILSEPKTDRQSYCDTSYHRGGVNQMCILQNVNDRLEYIQTRSFSSCYVFKHLSSLPFRQLFLTLY